MSVFNVISLLGGLGLFLEGLGIAAIHISAALFQVAGDLLFPDEGFVCLDSLLIGPGVLQPVPM